MILQQERCLQSGKSVLRIDQQYITSEKSVQMRILIIIPAYNEEANIKRVIGNLKTNNVQADYLVVNDGSKDRTAEICIENHYPILDLPINLGLVGAFQAGLRYAVENGYDAVLQFDGDGQHDPTYIEVMLNTMKNEQLDVVIGSRFCEKLKPHTLRMLGSSLISFAIRLTTGQKITDPTSGMRIFNLERLSKFSQNINYGPEPDTISYLLRCGARVKEVQVEMHERVAGTSYLNLARSVRYMLNMFISILFVQFFRPRGIL